MNKNVKNIKPDSPLSITDGAPRIIKVCGQDARIPAAMDYRIMAKVAEQVPDVDETDQAVIMLYCCLHATKPQIGNLWRLARDPTKLMKAVEVWQAKVPADNLADAINELMSYSAELDDEDGDDEEASPGKKKTGSR